MEEDKYYTPEIDEFFDKFEFEYKEYLEESDEYSNRWITSKFDTRSGLGHEITHQLYEETLRVKYLDKEDLIELGFNPVKDVEVNMCNKQIYYKDQKYSVVFNYDRITDIVIQKDSFPVFNGVVKNKSELIKVLKMLGIK